MDKKILAAQLQKLGISVEGDRVKKSDIKKVLAAKTEILLIAEMPEYGDESVYYLDPEEVLKIGKAHPDAKFANLFPEDLDWLTGNLQVIYTGTEEGLEEAIKSDHSEYYKEEDEEGEEDEEE